MRSSSVVVDPPVLDDPPGVAVAGEHVLVKALITQPADEALDQPVLHGLAGSDVVPVDPSVLLPPEHGVRGELGAVVRDHHQGVAATFSNPVQFSRNSLSGDGVVDDGGQGLPG